MKKVGEHDEGCGRCAAALFICKEQKISGGGSQNTGGMMPNPNLMLFVEPMGNRFHKSSVYYCYSDGDYVIIAMD